MICALYVAESIRILRFEMSRQVRTGQIFIASCRLEILKIRTPEH